LEKTQPYNCGTGPGLSGTVNLLAGATSAAIGPFPVGTVCTVTEPSLPGAPSGWTFGNPSIPGSPVTIIAGNVDHAQLVTVTNTISQDTGSLVRCGQGFTGTVSLDAGTSKTIGGIPTGTSCTISENPPAAPTGYSFGTPTFSPSNQVTISRDATVTVTTHNTLTRDVAGLKLTKALTGGPVGYTGPFTIGYDCGQGFIGTVSLYAGTSQTIGDIPTGTSCTVSETPPTAPTGYSFGSPTFSPSATVTITRDATVTVTTNNTLTADPGGLIVTKTVAGFAGFTGSFPVSVSCTGETSPRTGTIGYPSPGSITFSGIAAGSICTVTEGALPAAPGLWSWGAISYTDNPATILPDGMAGVGITNTLIPPRTPPTCEQQGTCPSPSPSPSPSVSPSPSPSPSVSPSPSPQGSVEAVTSKPRVTPPPTSSLGGTAGGPSSGIWLVLLVLAGLLGSILLLTPAPARARRKR